MSVVVSVRDVEPCRKVVDVQVPKAAVEAETDRVLQEFRRQARLPGFRKGKVPRSVILHHYRDDIEREVVERLVPRYWKQAQAESQLEPMITPRFSDVELEVGSSLKFSATVELRPEVKLGDYSEIPLPEKDVDPTEDELAEALEEIQRARATWVDVDREAARGDLVQVKLKAGEADKVDEDSGDEPQDLAFEVGDERVWEELSLAVTGQKSGREVRFERKNPQTPEEPATQYKLELVNVQTRELPELDDEFAASVGEFDNLAALKENVEARLKENKTQRLRQEREQTLMDELCARHPLDLPSGVVEEEQRRMLDAFASDLSRQGVDLDEANINWEEMAEKLRPRAEKQVHAGLVLDAVAEKESIAIPEERLEKVLGQIAAAEKTSAAALRRRMDEDGRLIALRQELLKQETIRHLLGETGEEQDD